MSRERKHINEIEIKEISGRWDAEPNEIIDRIFIRETGILEIIQKSNRLEAEVKLNQQTDEDLPILEILSIKGDNKYLSEDTWTIWRYSGDEMDIDFSDELRITFKLIN